MQFTSDKNQLIIHTFPQLCVVLVYFKMAEPKE